VREDRDKALFTP